MKLPSRQSIRLERMRRALVGQDVPGEKPWFIAPKMTNIFARRDAMYRICYGGRSAGRSFGFGHALLLHAATRPTRILCAREYQTSIGESIHQLLEYLANTVQGFEGLFRATKHTFEGVNGSEFIFRGLKTDPHKLKSLEGIDICYIEEAEKVSENSWNKLDPTIRKQNANTLSGKAEIWAAFNPDLEKDFFYNKFVVNTPSIAAVEKLCWYDNPWQPETMVQKIAAVRETDNDAYMHLYEGYCRTNSARQILAGKIRIDDFTISKSWSGPYFGADWGFAQDPTTLVKMYIDTKENKLYIDQEAYGVGVDIDHTPALFDTVTEARKYTIRGDSARPETISYLKRHGFPKIESVEKWKGSVEDGVAHLRQYKEIVIRHTCTHAIEEGKLYNYKIDKLSGDILPDIEDKNNHIWDAARYGLAPIIKQNGAGEFLKWISKEVDKHKTEENKVKFEDATHHKVDYINLLGGGAR